MHRQARLEILTSNWAKLFRPRRVWAHVHKQIKMASQSEPDQEELFNGIKGALKRQKSKFERQISNVHKLKDLDETFNALEKLAEAVVKGKYGPLRYRHEHEISHVYPMLERTMIIAKNGINTRLTPRMSKIHPWVICFDVPMPQEVFSLLNKGIVNRTSYGVDVSEKPGSVTITFTNMRRLCALFNKFEDCEAFTKELGAGKGVVKLIVDDRKNGIMRYKFKEEILQFNFHYGYWNAFGIIQH